MEQKYYKVVVRTVNELEDPVKAKALWRFRMMFSAVFSHAENVHLVFNYIECQNSFYKDRLGAQSFMPVIVYVNDKGVFDAFSHKKLDFDMDFIKFDEVTPSEYAKYRCSMDNMSTIMYPETINEIQEIIEKSKFQYENISKKHEEGLARKRVRDSKNTFANRFKNRLRRVFDNSSQK